MTNDGPCPRGARVQADGESRWLRRTVASATAVGGILLVASCNERPLPSPGPASGVNAQAVSGGPFTFENFELGAATDGVPGLIGVHERRRGARDSRGRHRYLLRLLGARPRCRHARLEVY